MKTYTKISESKISAKGQTTVPVEIRKRFGCAAGTRLAWEVMVNGRLMVTVKNKSVAELKSK